eukprot:2939085-Alexandrium_andersonii.AAC.1
MVSRPPARQRSPDTCLLIVISRSQSFLPGGRLRTKCPRNITTRQGEQWIRAPRAYCLHDDHDARALAQ